jgi:beta-glucanase (GH16 family)
MSTIPFIGAFPGRSHSKDKSTGEERPSLIRKAGQTVESSVIAVGVTVSVLAMFVPMDFVHLPSFRKPNTVSPTGSSSSSLISRSNVDLSKCTLAPATAGQEFASCPSFILDYSKLSKGTVDEKNFSIFKGRSETNDEQQMYTASSDNIRIENGMLVLQARMNDKPGARYTSARIDTKGKEDFLYGKIVVRAKMPAGTGTWPAIWMLPSQPKYSDSKTPNDVLNGEIDIAEAIGLQPNLVYGVAHTQAYDNNGVDKTFFNTATIPGNDTSFHDYEIDWTPASITFKVDGKVFYTYAKRANADFHSWPFDQPFYLIINLAMGGSWGGQDRKNFPLDGVDQSALPASLSVQSVKYYSYTAQK